MFVNCKIIRVYEYCKIGSSYKKEYNPEATYGIIFKNKYLFLVKKLPKKLISATFYKTIRHAYIKTKAYFADINEYEVDENGKNIILTGTSSFLNENRSFKGELILEYNIRKRCS